MLSMMLLKQRKDLDNSKYDCCKAYANAPVFGVFMLDDEVHFLGHSALVWSKHNDVGSLVVKVIEFFRCFRIEQFDITTSAFLSFLKTNFVSKFIGN